MRVVRTGARPQTPQPHIPRPEALCRREPGTSFAEGLGSASCSGAAVGGVGAEAMGKPARNPGLLCYVVFLNVKAS